MGPRRQHRGAGGLAVDPYQGRSQIGVVGTGGTQALPETTEPVLHRTFKVAVAVGGAALQYPCGPGLGQGIVDATGKGLVVDPLGVATAQYRVTQPRPLHLLQAVAVQQGFKAPGTVRGKAVIGGGHHQQDALFRQCSRQLIQGHAAAVETEVFGPGSDLPGNVPCGAEAGAPGHGKGFPSTGNGDFPIGGRRRLVNRLPAHQSLVGLAAAYPQVKMVGFEGQGLLDVQLVVMGIIEGKTLQDHGHGEFGLGEGKLPADTGPLAIAEGFVPVGVNPCFVFRQEAVDIEQLRVAPYRRIPMQGRQVHRHALVAGYAVAPADDFVLVGRHQEGRGGRPQPQGLLEDPFDHVQLRQVAVPGYGGTGQYPVHLPVGLGKHVGVAQQKVQGKGQQAAGSLVPRHQEGEHLLADVEVIQALAGFRVFGGEHQVEQVVAVRGVVPALADYLVHQFVHGVDVRQVGRRVLAQPLQQGDAGQLLHVGGQHSYHGPQEGVQLAVLERIEAVIETRQGDGVQGQPRHVVRHQEIFPLVGGPVVAELAGHFVHGIEIAFHGPLTEGWHEDAMGLPPIGLFPLGGEQPVTHDIPQ